MQLTSGDHGGPKDKKPQSARKSTTPGGKASRAAHLREGGRFRESIRAAEQRRTARQDSPAAAPPAGPDQHPPAPEHPADADTALQAHLAACIQAAQTHDWNKLAARARQLAEAAGRQGAEARPRESTRQHSETGQAHRSCTVRPGPGRTLHKPAGPHRRHRRRSYLGPGPQRDFARQVVAAAPNCGTEYPDGPAPARPDQRHEASTPAEIRAARTSPRQPRGRKVSCVAGSGSLTALETDDVPDDRLRFGQGRGPALVHQPAGRSREQLHDLAPGTATSAGRQEGRYAYRVASSRTVAMSLNGSSSSLTI
ncbi:hypothetical protein [Streptomyces sp. NPDC058683]|uniref:hypothetical protein n=1 Tax=Streptomyces sp. NPDC058683 TaxID=3346597 RepID=UPI0036497F63